MQGPRTLFLFLATTGLLTAAPAATVADQSPAVTDYTVPTGHANPQGISAAPNGSIWFTETSANKIGELNPGGSVHEFAIPMPPARRGGSR